MGDEPNRLSLKQQSRRRRPSSCCWPLPPWFRLASASSSRNALLLGDARHPFGLDLPEDAVLFLFQICQTLALGLLLACRLAEARDR